MSEGLKPQNILLEIVEWLYKKYYRGVTVYTVTPQSGHFAKLCITEWSVTPQRVTFCKPRLLQQPNMLQQSGISRFSGFRCKPR
jgi:hypothetical protein